MKIWLDDLRPAPPGWTWIKDAEEAVRYLGDFYVTDISLDHDLGDDYDPDYTLYNTGYDVAKWIEEQTAENHNYFPPRIFVHTDNPVGRANIQQAINKIRLLIADRYWEWITPPR